MSSEDKIRQVVRSLNPIDDIFFRKMAEYLPFCEEILRVILADKELTVDEALPQHNVTNLQGRSVILDVKCRLGTGEQVNIEVQKSDDDDHQRRVRYNAAVLTANITDTGTRFREVPDVIVVYISRFDSFKQGKTIYHIDRTIRETGRIVYNGLSEIYVNAAVQDGSDIAELMRVFTENDVYNEKFPITSARKRQFKESIEEEERMNEELKKLLDESEATGRIAMLCDLVKEGLLTIAVAAKKAGMTEDAFKKLAML